MAAKYDTVGVDYAALRRPDPRIAAQIEALRSGADTSSMSAPGRAITNPSRRDHIALEPAWTMIASARRTQRRSCRGALRLCPLPITAFDAVMASLTVHHWSDQAQGLRELRRVRRGRWCS
jgi:hypothetical protein